MPRTVKKILFGLGCFVLLTFAAGLATGYLSARLEQNGSGGPLINGVLLTTLCALAAGVVMVGAIWSGVVWMRSIDEAAQEAHKSAWFWGGSIGAAVGGFAVILSFLPPSVVVLPAFSFFDRTDPVGYMASGAYAMLLLMMAGYGVAWAWWWWKRR